MSDVHSNLAALEAVLADAGSLDAIWHLGDGVGYGPQRAQSGSGAITMTPAAGATA